jgi:transcription elongation factor Elf1
MSTEKRNTLTAPLDEMCQQFKGRIICGRCGNSDWSKFTYMLPMDDRVLVQCSNCGLTFFKSIEDTENNGLRDDTTL